MDDALTYAAEHREEHEGILREFLAHKTVSTDRAHAADVREGARWVAKLLEASGLGTVEVHETDLHPIVTASWLGAGPEAPTVLVYGHYDVQPPDPLEQWETPPFEPTVRDGKIYARGATDDKGQLLTHILSVRAILETEGELPVNVKFILEGEEEVGSPSLGGFVEAHRELLACDTVLVSDTAMWAPDLPAVTLGMRGLAYIQLDARGPDHDLHSGVYGGAVRNPANALALILSRLHEPDGRVAVPGFYDDVEPIPEALRETWRNLPQDEEELRRELGVPAFAGEEGYSLLERRWGRPTLDVNGLWGGFQGEGAKTIIPSEAHAKVSMRLVADQDPDDIVAKVRRHVADVTPAGVEVSIREMHHATPVRISPDAPAVKAANRALEATFGRAPVAVHSGGTIPVIAIFDEVLGVPSVLMGFGLRTENLHAPNEHFHLENLHRGVEASTRYWYEVAEALAAPSKGK